MRSRTQYVIYPRWPQDGCDWIHPEDVAAVRNMVPGRRVFRYVGTEGPFRLLRYGGRILRVRAALWLPVRGDSFQVGEWVEVRSRVGKNRPGIGRIGEMLWNRRDRRIDYLVCRRGMLADTMYQASDLVRVNRLPAAADGP
jgi:hypothetical protein